MKKPNKLKKQSGGIVDPMGQWKYPGKVTTIPGNNITMRGVPYPVLGVSNTGDKKFMLPGRDYKFNGNSVTEYPMFQAGGKTPIYVSDPNDPRLKAYSDSLSLYKAYITQDKLMGPGSKRVEYDMEWTPQILQENRKKGRDWKSEKDMRDAFAKSEEVESFKLIKYYKSLGFTDENIMYHTSPDLVHNKIKPTGTYWDGQFNSPIYKKPVQPIELVKTYGQLDPQATQNIEPYQEFGIAEQGIKPNKNKPLPTKPTFSIPSTYLPSDGNSAMKDIYEYDEATKQYTLIDSVSPEDARSIYGAIAKSNLESMKNDLNNLNSSGKRNPYTQKKQLGGAIGTTVGTALNFIPGVGPIVGQIATPLLSALGQTIEANIKKKDEKPTASAENAYTANPFGFQSGGKIIKNIPEYSAIYQYLISKGVSHNHAMGMLANVKAESNFNPGALGDSGTSGGLFQHHNERFNAMKAHAGENWMTNWQGQVDYALSENDTKKYLSQNFTSPEEASKWFTVNWERPANKLAKADERVKYLSSFNIQTTPTVANPVEVALEPITKNYAASTLNMPKQGIATKAMGGKLPGKLIPLKQEGKFEPLGDGLYIAKGPSHAKGGIDADLAINGTMDGVPEINLEGGEIVDDSVGYIFRKEAVSKKYLPLLKNLKDRTDQVSKNTRSHIRSIMISKNEELLAKEGKAPTMKAQSGMDLSGVPYATDQFYNMPTTTPITPVAPDPFVMNTAVPGIVDAPYNANTKLAPMNGGVSRGVPQAPTGLARTTAGTLPTEGARLSNTPGDWAQLAGIAVPTIYNAIKALQPAEEVKPVNNQYESQIKGLMANRTYNEQSTQNQITRAMNSGINQINNMTNSSSVRRANITNLIGNTEQQRAAANLQGQQMNNAYRAEQANMLNNLGSQQVAAKNLAQNINYANRGAKDAYGLAAVEGIGQGLTAFGQMKNANAYNNRALAVMNSAFPNYYWDTATLNSIASGAKPSWMSDADFQKAQAILYRK